MDEPDLESVLGRCEVEIASGRRPDLRLIGFWRSVTVVKKRPDLVARYADRMARIDRAVFVDRVKVRFPAMAGVALLSLGSVVGLVILWLAAGQGHPLRELAVLVGMGALLVCTHNLAHFIVGTVAGIRFTDWFMDLPKRPQPGLKIDYASYLRAPARSRAWMHASGAVVTKLVPFALILYAGAIGCDLWVAVVLLVLGVAQIVTDVAWSVKASDWKKYRREMRLARR
ncbi:MAG TPA: hypothetical protein VM052_00775 [Candidatus Limnocylindrales bacterium]|nr:hypothetical protein [Candidatus Limnocylindrales bacterium]